MIYGIDYKTIKDVENTIFGKCIDLEKVEVTKLDKNSIYYYRGSYFRAYRQNKTNIRLTIPDPYYLMKIELKDLSSYLNKQNNLNIFKNKVDVSSELFPQLVSHSYDEVNPMFRNPEIENVDTTITKRTLDDITNYSSSDNTLNIKKVYNGTVITKTDENGEIKHYDENGNIISDEYYIPYNKDSDKLPADYGDYTIEVVEEEFEEEKEIEEPIYKTEITGHAGESGWITFARALFTITTLFTSWIGYEGTGDTRREHREIVGYRKVKKKFKVKVLKKYKVSKSDPSQRVPVSSIDDNSDFVYPTIKEWINPLNVNVSMLDITKMSTDDNEDVVIADWLAKYNSCKLGGV